MAMAGVLLPIIPLPPVVGIVKSVIVWGEPWDVNGILGGADAEFNFPNAKDIQWHHLYLVPAERMYIPTFE